MSSSAPAGLRQAGHHIGVTGAGTGIGRAVALRLGAEGARLSLYGRRLPLLEATADAARAAGAPEVRVFALDQTAPGAADAAVAAAAAALGPLRAFVANSGVGGPNAPGPDDRFDLLVSTNLTGTYRALRAAQAQLADGPGPRHLVVVASILARFGVAGYTGYCASKAGLLGLVRALALELAPAGVQVNAICPGWVDTEMAREGIAGMAQGMGVSYEEALKVAMSAVPLGKMSQPAHIAGLIAWLLSDDAAGVTGQGLDMNNGAWM
jgi:NAD(P)-dependent dehydrogenase (short-subunit alcohol dehydrogenase family)